MSTERHLAPNCWQYLMLHAQPGKPFDSTEANALGDLDDYNHNTIRRCLGQLANDGYIARTSFGHYIWGDRPLPSDYNPSEPDHTIEDVRLVRAIEQGFIDQQLGVVKGDKTRLLPIDVVIAARAVRHPLHSKFDWGDTEEALLHRIEQARRLIRSLRVERTYKGHTFIIPVWWSGGDGYVRVEESTEQEAIRAVLLAARAASGHLLRVGALSLALGVTEPNVGRAIELLEDLIIALQANQ